MQTIAQDNKDSDDPEYRLQEFMDSFGNNGFVETAIIKCLENIHDLAAITLGEDAAGHGLDAMVRDVLGDLVDEFGWRGALEEELMGLYSETPLGGLFHDLEAYADFGVVTGFTTTLEQRAARLERQIRQCRDFMRLVPLEAWGMDDEYATGIWRKAEARWKLDNDEPITIDELCVLSGLARQTLKNLMSQKSGVLVGTVNRIEAQDALNWLVPSKKFRPSVWRDQVDDSAAISEIDEPLGNIVFAPVAPDGTVFHPGLKRSDGYVIGPEDREQTVADYDEALTLLHQAQWPKWRRPTKAGIWTRVRGVKWERYTRSELDAMAQPT